MNATELRRRLGQRLCAGFEGFTIPQELIDAVREYKIGNIILFRRNVRDREQLTALCRDLRTLIRRETGLEPFIMLDEESGSVSRLAHIAIPTPSAMAIGATADPENARVIGRLVGDELRAVGANMTLAPVLDCFTNPDNTVCGNRCFESDPEAVARFGVAYIQGLREAGVLGCGKHFPGHGDTAVDSHLALPTVQKSMDEMRRVELVPFEAAIRAGVDAIMSAHIVFPAIEPDVPGTVSRRVMTGLLRETLGFDGLIISDGMEMKAVMDRYGVPGGCVRALHAGVDIVLICHEPEDAGKTMLLLEEEMRQGRMTEEDVDAHFTRIESAKLRYPFDDGKEHPFASPTQRADAGRIMEASIRVLNAPGGQPLPALDGDTVVFGTKARRNALVNDDVPFDAAQTLARVIGAPYIEALPPQPPKAAVVLIGRHPEAQKTVDMALALIKQGVPLIAVSLYTPTCLRDLPDTVWKLDAWQYDELAVGALAKRLSKAKRDGAIA
ncbi:MAG: beta-N-acetylhexosaminidase [Clostridia bacterium]|nr:beta-N-acetylhexosaminidase [Clostridia bacterium]